MTNPARQRALWEMLSPCAWRSEVVNTSRRAGIDPFLVAAVVREVILVSQNTTAYGLDLLRDISPGAPSGGQRAPLEAVPQRAAP